MAGSPRDILIAEDDEDTLLLIKEAIEDAGYQVQAAKDGGEALAKAGRQAFELIIADIRMPRLDGLALAASLRSTEQNADTPLLIMTGSPSIGAVVSIEALGIARVLPKPFTTDELIATMSEMIAVRQSTRGIDATVAACVAQALGDVMRLYITDPLVVGDLAEASSSAMRPGNGESSATGVTWLSGPEQSGFVACSLPNAMLKSLCQTTFPGVTPELTEAFAADLASEMARQVADKIRDGLARLGTQVSLGVPLVASGEHRLIHRSGLAVHRVDFNVAAYQGWLEFGLGRAGQKRVLPTYARL